MVQAERLQKILARVGIASRRKAEELISQGLVTINGKVAQLGDKAIWGKDAIKVEGKLLQRTQYKAPMYIAFYKPKGVICSFSDPGGRPHLGKYFQKLNTRVVSAGRLDFNSEGLLLLSNDGEFIEQLQKRDDIPRVYELKVKGHPDESMLARLAKGATFGVGHKKFFKPQSVRVKRKLVQKSIVELVVQGSGAYDLKSYCEIKGVLMDRIVRTAIGHVTLKDLEPGDFRFLTPKQVGSLLQAEA